MSINRFMAHGKIIKDLQLESTRSGKFYLNFPFAVPRDYKKDGEKYAESDIISCRAWAHNAEYIAKYASKNDWMIVTGRLQVDKYEKDGMKKTIIYVNVEGVELTRAAGAENCSGFKKMKHDNISNSFDDMGTEVPNVDGLDW